MKRIIFLLITCMTMALGYAKSDEPEKSSPSRDTEIVRRCPFMNIEGEYYFYVTVTLKSISPDYFFTDKYKVKIIVSDKYGNKIYKKTFKNSYLYIFSNGQIQVGKPKFTQVLITKEDDGWYAEIKEKEGIW